MKKHTMKKSISALCMVLALCMAFQSVTLAADLSADTSADTSVVAEEAETTDTNDANTAEEAEADTSTSEEEKAVEETPVEEAEADSSEEADPAEPVETDPAETEPAEDEESEEADSETEEEADALVTAQATVSTGWAQATDDEGSTYWTFSYLENSTVTTATQAVDEVLYIPACTVDTTTFKAGYYYFDENGKLVADGTTTSVGTVEVLKVSSGSYLCDDSADDSGKLVKVITTQADNANGTVLSSTMSYYSGKYAADGLHYSNGTLYTGFYRTSAGVLYYITDGSAAKYTGKYSSSNSDTYGSTTYTGDSLWYYSGKVFTGYIRRTSSDYVWVVKSGVGGTKLTGTMSTSKYYFRADTGTRTKGDGKYYKNGKVYSGVLNSYYYAKGVKQTSYKNCWKTFDSSGNVSSKSSDNTYYFTSSGKVYTSCWKNLKRNGTTYRFYFNSDGTLCKNLYKKSSAWKKKATKLVISRGTHTATLYATYNGSYKIPTKSFVVSTSRSSSNFKVGTYKLSQRQSWFTISSTNWWYKWATYISGSGSWCHSEQYYTKGNSKSLRISSYNDLGTNQSKQCIRMQVVNAKLIYDMRGYGSIKTVVLNQSTNAGPFGKMTITDNVDKSGKLSGTKGYDPTDPLYT
ncbi:MAG: L,D-transpeptidase [Clostridiales bacterium]|nr:L,D-transpeptidase [Clostridiales bacterium]